MKSRGRKIDSIESASEKEREGRDANYESNCFCFVSFDDDGLERMDTVLDFDCGKIGDYNYHLSNSSYAKVSPDLPSNQFTS